MHLTADEVKESIFEKYKRIEKRKTDNKTSESYVLKVSGFRSYFVGGKKLIRFILSFIL